MHPGDAKEDEEQDSSGSSYTHWGSKQMEGDEGQQNPYSLLHVLMQWIGHTWGFPDGTCHHTHTTVSSAA